MELYSIVIGVDGLDGLEKLVETIRFDDVKSAVYIAPVIIKDESFTLRYEQNGDDSTETYHTYSKTRMVSLRQGNYMYRTDVFSSPDVDRYYLSLARFAPYLRYKTFDFFKHNINGKYKIYNLVKINNIPKLVLELDV